MARHRASRGSRLDQRLDALYGPQARHYDSFRERLLHGRQELINALPVSAGALWVDLGGGTGRTLECLGPAVRTLRQIAIVDLSAPLLQVAADRVASHGWTNVSLHRAAAEDAPFDPGSVDVVLCSYSLTMMPDWFAAVDTAYELLRPGGLIGVVDFHVSRKHATPFVQHSRITRWLTRLWFSQSDVFVSTDHLPYLAYRFRTQLVRECRGGLPYLPGVRVPYYLFVGRKSRGDVVTR